ncbi:hypothetical protein BH708_17515 [Brachybacterium sp. P6-10-X1]|uniref:hypothetical protein n=1 Tax=Brachybacterium sp. P6-10-X1 TaxID=1903186 RepID=UPI000971ACB6|nr:hypothetical protein [Brachybacterium sp. P6-10-X1]APX34204.1 hypothetical protein BH708_17515 [Brachybacterium sp. P6-10-X1]
MSDGESTTPAPRKRPTYGLPGPTTPQPGGPSASPYGSPAPHGAPAPYGSPEAPGASFGQHTHAHDANASADPSGAYAPATGPLPPQPGGPAAPRRRRGLWPLLIGLALLLIIAPAATVGGLVWAFGSLVDDASSGPTVIEGGTGQHEMSANEMLILYVPAEDAAEAECTAEGSSSGSITEVPTSGSVTFGDGTQYEQVMGVAASADTTVSISCTGTDAPAFLGPYSLLSVAAPMLIGPVIGIVAGLVGLVLIVVGILLLVRSRRS